MKINISSSSWKTLKCDALIVPLYLKQSPPRDIDKAMKGVPGKAIKSGEFKALRGKALVIHSMGNLKATRLVLVGLGKKSDDTAHAMRMAGGAALKALRGYASGAALYTEDNDTPPTEHFVEGMLLGSYSFDTYKKPDGKPLGSLTILAKQSAKLSSAIKYARTAAEAVNFARDLINTPARQMTPTALLKAARGVKGINVRAITRAQAAKLGMNAFLSVSGGSDEPPVFIIATYSGGKKSDKPTVLVGKAVTFDSGGLSLKPSASMETMKYDMSGGAAVLGVLGAAAKLKLKQNLVALIPATENLPGGQSPNKPGDVVRAFDGTTIEILNTDAEGRLALADTISYAAARLRPARIIDIATLTGACDVALGGEAMALMGNNDKLIKNIARAGDETHERAWHMPLYEEYRDYIKSEIADVANISVRKSGGLVTAGCFLERFAGKAHWAHLDIASTAWAKRSGPINTVGATGVGVRLLLKYVSGLK